MFLLMVVCVIAGIFVGVLPGLTALMGVTLLLPFTYGMDATSGMVMLVCIYFSVIYGGSITAILLKIPGTPASAATLLDGAVMGERGEGGRAIGISTIATFCGGIISSIACASIAPQLARIALEFGPSEYFALAFFGLTIIASVSGKSLSKGLIAGCIGLIISTVGMDPISGFPRLTFGISNLYGGFSVVPILIGFFAIANVIKDINESGLETTKVVKQKIKRILPSWQDIKTCFPISFGSGIIGTFIGVIPAAGPDIGAWVTYDTAKRVSRKSKQFGTGIVEGVAAPEAGNNAVCGGAMVPMLTLGIPGDATTAVMLGALTMQGLQPGPLLFRDNAPFVFNIFAGMFVANILILILGLAGVRLYAKMVSVKPYVLTPIIFLMCIVGSFALNNNFFDVLVTMIAGFIGYFFLKLEIPIAPMCLAIILGPIAESNLRRAFILSRGDLTVYASRPITIILLALAFLAILIPLILRMKDKKTGTEGI
jgi:putative tricarboxylic transport membrane protein